VKKWLHFHDSQLSWQRLGIEGASMEAFDELVRAGQWQLIALIVTIAVVTMALLQLCNELLPVRTVYHTYLLRTWIRERGKLYGGQVDPHAAFAQLIAHATGGSSRAFLSLPPAQLVGQINAAAQTALDSPKANYDLLAVLSQPSQPNIPLILPASRSPVSSTNPTDDLEALLAYHADPPLSADDSRTRDYLAARTRVVHRIQRNLDGMQIALGSDSALINQILAILISITLTYVVIRNRAPGLSYTSAVLLVGVSAGYVAPILGDIVAAIRKLGRT